MPFLAVCASCGRESHVPDCAAGASVWCPQCARYFAPLPQNPAAPIQLRVRHEPALPFLAACTFCGRQSHVPAGARGTWLRCPQCANFFVAAPAQAGAATEHAALPKTLVVPPPVRPAPEPMAEPSPEPAETAAPALPAVAVETLPVATVATLPEPAAVPTPSVPVRPHFRKKERVRAAPDEEPQPLDLLGLGALFLGCAALLCASVAALFAWLLPLATVGLIAGLAALVRAAVRRSLRVAIPIGGTALAAAVLLAAWLSPDLFGPAYRAYRDQSTAEVPAPAHVAVPGGRPGAAADPSEWADASRTALVQGQVQVYVLKASVERVEIPSGSGGKGKAEVYLVLRLRAQQTLDAGAAPGKKRAGPTLVTKEHQPTLMDLAGKVYALVDAQPAAAVDDTRAAASLPVTLVEWVLIFEPPPGGVQQLHLELPAAAWGGSGVFRFAIPASMIQRASGGR